MINLTQKQVTRIGAAVVVGGLTGFGAWWSTATSPSHPPGTDSAEKPVLKGEFNDQKLAMVDALAKFESTLQTLKERKDSESLGNSDFAGRAAYLLFCPLYAPSQKYFVDSDDQSKADREMIAARFSKALLESRILCSASETGFGERVAHNHSRRYSSVQNLRKGDVQAHAAILRAEMEIHDDAKESAAALANSEVSKFALFVKTLPPEEKYTRDVAVTLERNARNATKAFVRAWINCVRTEFSPERGELKKLSAQLVASMKESNSVAKNLAAKFGRTTISPGDFQRRSTALSAMVEQRIDIDYDLMLAPDLFP